MKQFYWLHPKIFERTTGIGIYCTLTNIAQDLQHKDTLTKSASQYSENERMKCMN